METMGKEELESLGVKALALRMRQLKDRIDELSKEKTSMQKEFDLIRKSLLPERMEDEGIQNLTLKGIGRVSLRPELYVSIPADSKPLAYEWLKEHGYASLVTPYVQPSTLKAWAKEQIEHGVELPEDLFVVSPYTMATITKA